MPGKEAEKIARGILDRYHQRTVGSKAHDTIAREYLPGGDTRSTVYHGPYPAYMVKGEGCHLYDCDGNDYLDFLGNYSSIIHGHRNSKIIKAARDQLERGTIFGAPSEIQYIHAKHLCERVPSLESVRYCNSGTEATQFALRAARAFTGRDGVLKMDGGYHGTHDVAQVNLRPDLEAEWLPQKHVGAGVPASAMQDVVISLFNDLDATETLLKDNRDRIAAIIIEPIMGAGGLIEPLPGYLKGLRKLADRYNVLLIFDEIISFRLGSGGMQAIEGVTPDMTTLGKIIGGGMAIGAFGGRQDIMAVFDPSRPQSVNHGGTFNGHNVTLAAGLVALEMYDQAAADRINALGDRLREGFTTACDTSGINGKVTGRGSLLNVHWMAKKPHNAKESALGLARAGELVKLFHLEMHNCGVYAAPRGMFITSTPMTEKEIDMAIEAFKSTLALLNPYIAERVPHLMDD